MAEHINVFLSSTSKDLVAHRQMAKQAIADLDAFPVAMEEFTADKANALKKCYDAVQKAEVFIGVYAHRYGFAPPSTMRYEASDGKTLMGDGVTSITEWEYRWAVERDIPMLLYVLADSEQWQPKWVDDEPEKSRLAHFKATIRNQHIVPEFTTPENLAYQIATDLSRMMAQIARPTPTQSRADFYQHIPFPLNYVRRPQLLEQIKHSVLQQNQTHKRNVIALHGMGGVGKSVMARALCEDENISQTFKDGILWARIGQQPDLVARLREWITALGGTVNETAPTLDSLKAQLAQGLTNKACLLIVDDVWERKHAEIFLTTNTACRFIITTRDAEIARALRAQLHSIRTMQTPEAVLLLEDWSDGALQDTPRALKETIVDKLGHLPLAIRLAGAQLQRKDPHKWLENYDGSKLQLRRVEDVHDSLELTFGLSLSALDDTTRQHYIALAIFKEDEPILYSAIAHLWREIGDWDEDDIHDTVEDLASRALLELTTDGNESVILHDLLRDFIAKQVPDMASLHQTLLRAYNPRPQAWHTIADDGYLYDHLAYHLRASGNIDELRALFADTAWLNVRVAQRAYDYDGYIQDLMTLWYGAVHPQALAQIDSGAEAHLLPEVIRYALIRTSINSLASNYPPELIGRAIQLQLKGWTTTRALSIANRVTYLEQRVRMCAFLLQTDLLTANEQTLAKEIALKALNIISDKGSWVKTAVIMMPFMNDTERNAIWNDKRLDNLSLENFMLLADFMPMARQVPHIHNILAQYAENRVSRRNFRANLFAQFFGYLSPNQHETYLTIVSTLRENYQDAVLQIVLPMMSGALREKAQPLVDQMNWRSTRKAEAHKDKPELVIDTAPPAIVVPNTLAELQAGMAQYTDRSDYFEHIAPHLSPQLLEAALNLSLVIGDDHLAERVKLSLLKPEVALAEFQQEKAHISPPAPLPDLPFEQHYAELLKLSEEKRSRRIVALLRSDDGTHRPQLLSVARDLNDEWYRAGALTAFIATEPDPTPIIREIREACVQFLLRRATRQREYLLHFLTTSALFTPPILSEAITQAIVQQVDDICAWKWL
jgi:hypothetical protein